MMKEKLVTVLSGNGAMKQRLIIAIKDVLGYKEALYSKAAKLKRTVTDSFWGSFTPLV